jgi:hypothetical protein
MSLDAGPFLGQQRLNSVIGTGLPICSFSVLLPWLLTDPSDKPSTTPKLDHGAVEKFLGFFDSFAVVSANEDPVANKMVSASDGIGPVILHVTVLNGWITKKATPKRQTLIRGPGVWILKQNLMMVVWVVPRLDRSVAPVR